MKVIIEKFGPVKKFEYDLDKDMIVTYGNNNIGKSYAMQIVYLLLKTFIDNVYMLPRTYRPMYLYSRAIDIPLIDENIGNLVQSFMDSDEDIKDITQDIVKEVYSLLSASYMPEFMNSCKNTFGNLEKTLENNPEIKIQYNEYESVLNLKESKMTGTINFKPVRLKKTVSDFHKSRNSKEHLDIYVVDNTEKPVELILEKIEKEFSRYVQFISGHFGSVYFLPASRSGIYAGMNAFGSIVAELSKNRAYFTKKIEFPGISEPISDYFIALSNIKVRSNESLKKYYSDIEDEILKGKVTFDKTRNALMYKPDNVEALYEMTEVSSMVSEISPIVAFMKYIIPTGYRKKSAKSILFIEEPEAHLHPYNQIALIDIFSKLIGENVKLIMSSHSNYVFNKLNNLVLDKKLDYHLYDPIVLKETQEGSISKHISVDDLGAEDENFLDVSEALYNEREEIIEKMNMEE
nr:AAA family ATPase [uncultured Blautia sp.]